MNYKSKASFLFCLLVLIALHGSLYFSLFGGLGTAYYPISLIWNYLNKPENPKAEE